MEGDTDEGLSPMLLEMSPSPAETKKRAWPRRLQIPLGVLVVGLVGGGVLCFLSFADSKDIVNSVAERDRRNIASTGCIAVPSEYCAILYSCSTGDPSRRPVNILVRKEVGNPLDYFEKSYEEYKEGFAARGVFKKYLVDDII